MHKNIKLITLIAFSDKAAFFQLKQSKWHSERLKGEEWSTLRPNLTLTVPSLLRQLSERLNSESKMADVELHIVYIDSAIQFLQNVTETLAELNCTRWQILRWEPLFHRACSSLNSKPDVDKIDNTWIITNVLPILQSAFNYSDEAFAAEHDRAIRFHEETLDSLRAEKQRLTQEKADLQIQVEALQLPNIERLLVFLPAIYRNFWGRISPYELGLMAQTFNVPEIPSPQHELSNDTVLQLKRQMLRLPEEDRKRILYFCKKLPHKLEVRPEMRDLLEDAV
jgi:hypothetical protein